jgi:hypothetical protein
MLFVELKLSGLKPLRFCLQDCQKVILAATIKRRLLSQHGLKPYAFRILLNSEYITMPETVRSATCYYLPPACHTANRSNLSVVSEWAGISPH